MSNAAVLAFSEITEATDDDYLYVPRDTLVPLDMKIKLKNVTRPLRSIEDITDAALLIDPDSDNDKCFDCFRSSAQTLTIDTLTAAHNGFLIRVCKHGAGDITISPPAGVNIGGHAAVTLTTVGYECILRYNHARLTLTFLYSGAAE